MQPKLRDIAKAYIAKRLFGTGPVDDYSYVDQFQGPAKDVKLLGMYAGVAYRCINTLAEAVAGQYAPFFYTLDSQGKKQTVPSHPFLDVLNNPNPDLTYYQLVEGSASFVEQFGEFFWYMVPGALSGFGNGVKQIILLRPDKMGIVLDKRTGEVIGYKYSAGTGSKVIPFEVEEIMHFMTFNPKNPYRGFATLEAAADYVQTEEEVSRFTRNYFRNNAAMSGILSVEGKLTRDNWNKFVRQWRERYQGVDNAGKVALVRDSQVKFTPVTSSISDMQLTELKETTVDQILMMFRIPKGLFGMESDQGLGRASVETLEYIFAKWTIDNKLSRLDDFIELALKKYYPKDSYQVGHVNIIPDDKEYLKGYYDVAVDRWITREEIRAKDPDLQNNIIDGSDQLFTTIQQMPLDAESTEPVADNEPTKAIKLVKQGQKKNLDHTIAQKEAYRLGVERQSVAYARKYRLEFNKVLNKQHQTVLENIKHLKGKAIGDDLMDLGEEDSNFQVALEPVLTALILEQGQEALKFSGAADSKYVISQSLRAAIAASTKKMSQNFDQETIGQLNETLNEGLMAGESIADLSTRVSSVYDTAQGYRSDRVARTESSAAANGATVDAYQQNPAVVAMTWYANPGACEYCEELDGTTVGLEDVFVAQGDSVDVSQEDGSTDSYQADYGNVDSPPLHPNCACTIVPETDLSTSAIKPKKIIDTITMTKSELGEMKQYISELEKIAGVADEL